MRYELTDYQRAAAADVITSLNRARHDWRTHGAKSSFALSAITGAGKTVVASAVVEAMFFGSADLNAEPDPSAAFLWITDDPALNRQTRHKMMASSDLLGPAHLTIVDDDYLDPALNPGHVYFLNIQKLSKRARLNQSGTNLRQSSFWDILSNTIASDAMLYVILDEAHRGMKSASDRQTIVQRIINGHPGSNPPAPSVWGISATIKRFTDAMGTLVDRTAYPHVEVDIDAVRASGLVKDAIGLAKPDESGTFSLTLLRDAVLATRDYEHRWAAYSAAEGEPEVLPVLVVQVPDKADEAKLAEIVHAIESEWPGLGPNAIAHVFGEHEPIVLGSRTIAWEQPERIQYETDIRVVLAKEAISTGWDCPRAEVLYSERPARDSTHIAQIIGRMVRQPLARRVATDDALNSVTCYLPLFDQVALTTITDELQGKGKANGLTAVGSVVLREPTDFGRNPSLDPDVFDVIETLPSIPAPDKLANPIRRAKQLAMLLVDDASGSALMPEAGENLSKVLRNKVNGLAAEHAGAIRSRVEDLKTAQIITTTTTLTGTEKDTTSQTVTTHVKDLDRDTRKVLKSVKEGVALEYFKYRAHKAGTGADLLEIQVEIAALLLVDGVIGEIEAAATTWVQDRLAQFAVDIKNTTGATRESYRKVQEQTTTPEAVTVDLRTSDKAATKDSNGDLLPTFGGHLFADSAGQYPAKLNDWETTVVQTELGRPSTVAWYRNPSRATPNALRIAYQDDAGKWSSLQVDFIIVSKRDDGSLAASIVDPHGDHLADAKAKLLALAGYAETHGKNLVRIESLAKDSSGALRTLDLLDGPTRAAIRAFKGGKVTDLYEKIGTVYK